MRYLTSNRTVDREKTSTGAPALGLPEYRVVKGIAPVSIKIGQNEQNSEFRALEPKNERKRCSSGRKLIENINCYMIEELCMVKSVEMSTFLKVSLSKCKST